MIQRERQFVNFAGESIVFDGDVFMTTDISELIAMASEVDEYSTIPNPPKVREASVNIAIVGSPEQVRTAVEQLHSVMRPPTEEDEQGFFRINGYDLSGNVTNIRPVAPLRPTLYSATLTFRSKKPIWRRAVKLITFNNRVVEEVLFGNDFEALGYPHSYPFGFPDPNDHFTFDTGLMSPCAFQLEIMGYWDKPVVTINGHSYTVDTTVKADERLVINSSTRTVYKYGPFGAVNCFHLRGADCFRAIPAHTNTVEWTGNHVFYLSLLDERRMPAWI